MDFYKYCGAGNDFVLLDAREQPLPDDLPALARRLCDRRYGVGADGLMILAAPQGQADGRLLFYNDDGSRAEMCGNGARCLCLYCHTHRHCGGAVRIETDAGIVTGEAVEGGLWRVELNRPSILRLGMQAGGVTCDYLVLGENGIAHAVVEADLSRDRDELRQMARALRHDPAFPHGANVNLWQRQADGTLRLLTYERGVEDFTPACGTGNGATVAALTARGLLSGEGVRIQNDGGILTVDIRQGRIFLTGPAQECFRGTLSY